MVSVGESKTGIVSEPNIVSLIDVLLVLIIIFMVITPLTSAGLPVAVPQPSRDSKAESPDTVVVRIMQSGKLMINQDQTDWSSLSARLSDIFKRRAEKVAFVTGAEDVPFAQVARAIDIMKTAGVDHVGLITSTITERAASPVTHR